MYYPNVQSTDNTREMVRTFLGYNHNPVISDGEMYDMKNLSSDRFPLLSPRKKRSVIMQLKNTEWDNRAASFTKTVEGDLTYQEEKQTATITVDGIRNIRVSCTADTDILDNTRISLVCYDSNNVVIGTASEVYESDEITQTFLTIEGTASVEITITGHSTDVESFDPTKTYITDKKVEEHNDTVRGVLCKDGKLAYMIGQHLYYDDTAYDLEEYLPDGDDRISRAMLISFGAYILIFPLGIYFNTVDPTDVGRMDAHYEITGTVNYSICTMSGATITPTVSATAPSSPSDGDYWLKTGGDVTGLYVWSDSLSMWSGVATTYIKITIPDDISSGISEGDAVFLNTKFEDINNGSIVRAIGGSGTSSWIVVNGIMDTATDTETFTEPLIVERPLPELDYVCVSQNRVWGCYTGETEDGYINEIHASKLGDFKNWYVFDGTAADSYTVSIGDDGDFTGAITYNGYPLFFKENSIYRIYGSYPAAYQLSTYNCRGVQRGSAKSAALVGEYLIYKSIADICIFDGSSPVSISEALGDIKYKDAVAGAGLNKYYVSMTNEAGEDVFFVYDLRYNTWHKEDDLRIEEFTYNQSGKLYGQTGQRIYGFGEATSDFELETNGEKEVEWYAVTGILGLEYPDTKYPGRITIRADIPNGGEIIVYISREGEPWKKESILTGTGRLKSYTLSLTVNRSDNYRLKFEGHKDTKIYSITRQYDIGSDSE